MQDRLAARGRAVALAYGERTALAPSDFEVPAGKLTAIIGPNGSGKSTLLNALAGLMDPISGTLEVLGRGSRRPRRRVAYVLQAAKVNEMMPVTVWEVVGMGRYSRLGAFRRFRAADRGAVDEALDTVGIGDLADRHLAGLSAGQRQRVFVAQGLAQDADLLLLDEPLTGLDLVSRGLIGEAVGAELAAGGTVVVTTHDLVEATAADHVLLLAGRVVAEGPAAGVLTPGRLSEAYGVGVVHLEDGTVVLDDSHHRGLGRHIHFERIGLSREKDGGQGR
ncbi:MAG: metal ABC transporter ATP-binding protein [Acidimicrobiia bacterium]